MPELHKELNGREKVFPSSDQELNESSLEKVEFEGINFQSFQQFNFQQWI